MILLIEYFVSKVFLPCFSARIQARSNAVHRGILFSQLVIYPHAPPSTRRTYILLWILLTVTAVEFAHPSSSTIISGCVVFRRVPKVWTNNEHRDVQGDGDWGVMTFLVGTEAVLKSMPSKFLSVFGLDKLGWRRLCCVSEESLRPQVVSSAVLGKRLWSLGFNEWVEGLENVNSRPTPDFVPCCSRAYVIGPTTALRIPQASDTLCCTSAIFDRTWCLAGGKGLVSTQGSPKLRYLFI